MSYNLIIMFTVLIILLASFFAYVAWRRLPWAIALVILFLPAYLIRFQVGFLPMTVLEVMVLVLVIVWVVKRLVSLSKFKNVIVPWRWLILLFTLAGVVAVLISPDTRAALGLWKAYILEPVLFFIVFVNVIRTKKEVTDIFWALGALTVIVGYVTLLQYLNIVNIPAHYGLESPRRATSMFPFPTAVGKLIGPLVALFLGILLTKSKLALRPLRSFFMDNLFVLGVLVFGFMGLLFSVSRGALLGVFIALIFISFFSVWKKWLWLGMGLVIILVILIPQTRSNIAGVFTADDVSTDVRLVMWQGAVRIIKDNPITGTGLASFPIVYEDYKEASHTEFFPNPDHLILSLWIEMGLAGLVLFAWLVVKFFRAGLRALKTYRGGAVGLMAAMVALLVHGFFDTPYFKNDLAIAFWALMGLVVVWLKWGILI